MANKAKKLSFAPHAGSGIGARRGDAPRPPKRIPRPRALYGAPERELGRTKSPRTAEAAPVLGGHRAAALRESAGPCTRAVVTAEALPPTVE